MAKTSGISRPSASREAAKTPAFSPVSAQVAQFTPPAIRRHYTAKEFAAALYDLAGISLGERAIVRRCRLPAVDPARIRTNPAFTGRHYIPASELARIAGMEVTG